MHANSLYLREALPTCIAAAINIWQKRYGENIKKKEKISAWSDLIAPFLLNMEGIEQSYYYEGYEKR